MFHAYTFTEDLVIPDYRLAIWGSDATGIAAHYLLNDYRFKFGAYQLYENNVQSKMMMFHCLKLILNMILIL